jgi:cell division protein FtsB
MRRWIATIAVLATLLGLAIGFAVKFNQDIAVLRLSAAIQEQQLASSERAQQRCAEQVSELTDKDVQNTAAVRSLQEENDKLKLEITELEGDIESCEEEASHWMVLYNAELENICRVSHFSSRDELEQWLRSDSTSENDYSSRYDCDDFAMDLIRAAEQDGYLIGLYAEGDHVANFASIGNSVYIIEPQTDEVWLWGFVD